MLYINLFFRFLFWIVASIAITVVGGVMLICFALIDWSRAKYWWALCGQRGDNLIIEMFNELIIEFYEKRPKKE